VIIRFFVTTAFQKLRNATTFAEPAPPPGDKLTGWHFITLVGYDEHRQAFRLINSWSPRWGDHGYAWLSYDLLKTTRISAAYALDVGPAKPQPIVNVPPPPTPPPSPVPVPPSPQPVPAVQLADLQKLSCARVIVEADRPTIDIGPNAELHSGNTLKILIRSPEQISYLYVSYIQADGSVIHLVQPNALVPQPTLPRQTLVFGSGTDGQPKFTVSPPFGREMIIAIASRSPLFDHELPMQQTERDYLSEVRRALLYKPVPVMPDRELAATITTLTTSAR
jgi:Domain of unknown function (DUF4384)/Papain family cysteine protease